MRYAVSVVIVAALLTAIDAAAAFDKHRAARNALP